MVVGANEVILSGLKKFVEETHRSYFDWFDCAMFHYVS